MANGVLKVDPDELEIVRKNMDTDGDAFDKEIDKMLKVNDEKLRNAWEGEDADTFCNNLHNYLMKMKTLPQNMREMSNLVSDTNDEYKGKDEEFSDELNKEATNYVEDELKDQEL